MAYLDLEQYNQIMKGLNPIFIIGVVLFFLKEFSLLFGWNLFVDFIPDLLFLLLFSLYALFYIGPMFKPEWVEGYELPEFDSEEEEKELSEEEKELRDLERISL